MSYNNRRYLVIPTSILDQINFDEVLETSSETVRKSLDGTLTFVKYIVVIEDGVVVSGRPSFYSEIYQEYTHEDILTLLSTEQWTTSIQEI